MHLIRSPIDSWSRYCVRGEKTSCPTDCAVTVVRPMVTYPILWLYQSASADKAKMKMATRTTTMTSEISMSNIAYLSAYSPWLTCMATLVSDFIITSSSVENGGEQV